jgi:hypothetical protein
MYAMSAMYAIVCHQQYEARRDPNKTSRISKLGKGHIILFIFLISQYIVHALMLLATLVSTRFVILFMNLSICFASLWQ